MKKIVFIVICIMTLAGCNVVRTISNEYQYVQRGDTSVIIQTKTIESYDASKNL